MQLSDTEGEASRAQPVWVNATHLGYRGRADGRLHHSRLAGGFLEPGAGSNPTTRIPRALPGVLAEANFWFRWGFVR